MLESREESKSTRSDDVTSESRSPGGKLPILEAALADLRREVQSCHTGGEGMVTLAETNIAPENGWLEY